MPHRPQLRLPLLVAAAAWVLSLLAVWQLAVHYAAPKLRKLTIEQSSLREERNALRAELDQQRGELVMAQRSDQVTRSASQQLQATLLEREEEIAALRADVGFYERLVSGSAQRQGLTVHSVVMTPESGGTFRYAITLTQSLKKGGLTRGEVSLAIEGALEGRLTELDWRALRQDADAAPQLFEFRYFQQIEGIIMVPATFQPQSVRVLVRADAVSTDRVYPWRDTQPAAKGI